MTDTFPTQNDAVLRIVDDQYHLGFYQEGIWVDLGRAVIRTTFYEEGTGAHKMMWTLAENDVQTKDTENHGCT